MIEPAPLPAPSRAQRLTHLGGLLLLAAFTGLAAWAALHFIQPPCQVPYVWLPGGAALAMLLLRPRRQWWQYLLTALLANIAGDICAGAPLSCALVLPPLGCMEVFIAAMLMRPITGMAPNLSRPSIFWRFCFLSVCMAPFATAMLASSYLWLKFGVPLFATISQYFLSDSLGIAIVTPVVLSICRGEMVALFATGQRLITLRHAALGILLISAVFYQTSYPLLFLIPPVLLGIASVQGLASVSLILPFLAFVSLAATVLGHGPMALARSSALPQKIFMTQMFLFCNYMVLCFVANIATERRETTAKLSQLAMIDGLTGIANRRCFNETLANEWRRVLRRHEPISLLILDIDRFKAFNDVYGHPEGDACIARLAQKLTGFAKRPGDLAARYGGEELVVLLPGCRTADAIRIAEQIRESIEALKIPHNGNRLNGGMVTASIGVATLQPIFALGEKDCLALIDQADKALYEAKRSGRNKVVAVAPVDVTEEESKQPLFGKSGAKTFVNQGVGRLSG